MEKKVARLVLVLVTIVGALSVHTAKAETSTPSVVIVPTVTPVVATSTSDVQERYDVLYVANTDGDGVKVRSGYDYAAIDFAPGRGVPEGTEVSVILVGLTVESPKVNISSNTKPIAAVATSNTDSPHDDFFKEPCRTWEYYEGGVWHTFEDNPYCTWNDLELARGLFVIIIEEVGLECARGVRELRDGLWAFYAERMISGGGVAYEDARRHLEILILRSVLPHDIFDQVLEAVGATRQNIDSIAPSRNEELLAAVEAHLSEANPVGLSVHCG